MATFFIVLFLILFFTILFANCYIVVEGEDSMKNVGGGMLFWPFIMLGICCLTDPIAERPIFFGVTAMLTLLSVLALMVSFCFISKNKTTILLNAMFYLFLFITLIYRYYHQPIAAITRCEAIISADNETFLKLSDSTRFCDWAKYNPHVFTVIKTEKIMSPSDKCLYCGKSVSKHEYKQYTEEEYKKSRNAKMQ